MIRLLRKHLRRLRQWLRVARMEARRAKLLPFLRWLLSGDRVSPAVYRHRLFVCKSCPIFDRKNLRCRAPAPHAHLGCGCFVPFVALAPAPYSGAIRIPFHQDQPIAGCWGHVTMMGRIGWPDALPARYDYLHQLTERAGTCRCHRCSSEATWERVV